MWRKPRFSCVLQISGLCHWVFRGEGGVGGGGAGGGEEGWCMGWCVWGVVVYFVQGIEGVREWLNGGICLSTQSSLHMSYDTPAQIFVTQPQVKLISPHAYAEITSHPHLLSPTSERPQPQKYKRQSLPSTNAIPMIIIKYILSSCSSVLVPNKINYICLINHYWGLTLEVDSASSYPLHCREYHILYQMKYSIYHSGHVFYLVH